jgi:calcium/calmodulin-dependent 3',5'-cyclic nucleotide phosphodiesterase
MGHYMIKHCQLHEILNLNMLDCLSFIIAGVCHDVGHDGLTNSYHSNAVTKRAIDSNDIAVQETFHAAQTFRILALNQFNFLEQLSREEFKLFRQRVVGLIIATDMARHAGDLGQLKNIINENEISQDRKDLALPMYYADVDSAQNFKNQQFILESCLHACDIS